MATVSMTHKPHLALIFAGAAVFGAWRKSKGKKGKRGSAGGRGNKFKGVCQFTDVDEDKVVRLRRRKQLAGAAMIAAKTPMAVWMRVVTDYGKTIIMNADQFEAGGVRGGVASVTPHFS